MNRNDYIYIENDSLDVYYNFALEYYLTSEKVFPDKIVFLIWRTSPTVMVGRFRNAYEEVNLDYVSSREISVVRRISGGGTIFTDFGGWQFTFITPEKMSPESFGEYTEPIIETLRKLGMDAYFDERNDMFIDGKKISGNARYTNNGFTVHHGSLLYSTDLEMMKRSLKSNDGIAYSQCEETVRNCVGNISDFLEKPMSMIEFRDLIIENFIRDKSQYVKLTSNDYVRLVRIAESRFKARECIYGENPEF
jgi:lipoate---protein ligase